MIIHNNLAAIQSVNQLNRNLKNDKKASQQLSTGEKFSSAGSDKASEYSISEKMRIQLRTLDANIKNSKDGKNLTNTAMGGLENITEILKTIEAKCLQAANDTCTTADRKIINQEINQALEEISDIAIETQFNGVYPLNSQSGSYNGTMVINNRYPYTANGQFRPVVSVGEEIRVSDEGGGNDYYNTTNMYINGTNIGDITSMPGWSAMQRTDDTTWSRTLNYVGADGTNINLTQKTVLKPVYSDFGIKLGESYFTSFEAVNNGGTPATIDFLYMVDTDLYPAGGNASRNEQFKDLEGHTFVKEQLYTKEANNIPDAFENWTASANAYGICGGVTVDKGKDGPDAVVLTRYGGHSLDAIKNGTIGGNNAVNSDLVFQMAWLDKKLTQEPLVFNTGGYGFNTIDKANPLLWIQSGQASNEGFPIKLCNATPKCLGIDPLDGVETRKDALSSLDAIQKAHSNVLKMSVSFGTGHNRCSSSEDVNIVYQENLSAAESTIRDTNMAKAMVEKTKSSILCQATQSMLAQANQTPQGVLSLLN